MRPALPAAIAAAFSLALPVQAQQAEPPTPASIAAAAPASDWRAIDPADLLVMTLAPDRDGKERSVIIQLLPPPFSQGWIDNIRTLARAHWWDGLAITRVQDNYVVQWGDPGAENEATAKPLPAGLNRVEESHYVVSADTLSDYMMWPYNLSDAAADTCPSADCADPEAAAREAERAVAPSPVTFAALEKVMADPGANEASHDAAITDFLKASGLMPGGRPSPGEEIAMISIAATQVLGAPEGWHERDSYAEWVEFWRGWPLANREVGRWLDENDNEVTPPTVPRNEAYALGNYRDVEESWFWPVHCYGMVGVGRDLSPDTGSGAELYTVIGHAPRQLDRNIALAGRVIEGIEHLSSLPRGTGPLGFYETAEERVPIDSIRLANDLPVASQPRFEYLATDSESFERYLASRANRSDNFYIAPAGGVDVCNVQVPIRRVPLN